MRIGLKYITPMLAAGAAAVAIGAAPIAAAAPAPAQPATIAAAPTVEAAGWHGGGFHGGGSTAAAGTAAVGTAAVGTAAVGGLGSIPGAGAGKRPIEANLLIQRGGGRPSRPSVERWVSFFNAPSAQSWYGAHNASVVAGYLWKPQAQRRSTHR